MQFDKEFIQTLRTFLIEKEVMDEFCEAYLSKNGMECGSETNMIINSFTWHFVQSRRIDWYALHVEWDGISRKKKFKNVVILPSNRQHLIAQLRESKLLKLKRYVNALRDYSE